MSSPKLRLRRALEDYQVDRADVEVQQCMKLTATNSPFGLTVKFTLGMEWPSQLIVAHQYSSPKPLTSLGDRSEGVTPVPIPNTAVKPLSPDGTAWATVWESRKSPD